ncbi:MAG: CaiB/BaiF CoA transferase family protein [Candidatus Puniceispirillales bacterium]
MQAFEGIRVLDLTHVLAGPFATYQLAVLGADVIKIESRDTMDMSREVGPVDELNQAMMGTHFLSQGSNKRAITLNLKTDDGKKIFSQLVETADVVVENFKCGTLAKLGFSYDTMKTLNPRIIYCSITGFGHTGPKAEDGAFDNIIQAYSGMMEATGPADDQAVMVGPPVLDYGTGAQAAFAIASALLRRERCGEGQHIDVAMLDCALTLMSSAVLNHSRTGLPPARAATGKNYVGAYGCYEAADTRVMIGTFTPRQNENMWRALGRDDLADEVRSLRLADLPKRRQKDAAILEEILITKTADEWEALLNAAGVPTARVRSLDETLESEQISSRCVRGEFTDDDLPGGVFRPAVAGFGCNEDGPSLHSKPAQLGQHNDDILTELGYPADTISRFRETGVI